MACSKPVKVDQDELDLAICKHRKYSLNLKRYENIGKSCGADARGLVQLADWIRAVLAVCPQCNISKTQFKDSALHMNKLQTCNFSSLPNRKWASQRALRWMTVLNHLRRLFRSSESLSTCLKVLPKSDKKILSSLLHLIQNVDDSDDDAAADESRDGFHDGSPKKRRLSQHDSEVSCDGLGIPKLLGSPKKPKEPEEEPVDLDDEDDVVDPPGEKKPVIKKVPNKSNMKKPSTTTTSTVHDTIGGVFDVIITYATKQSYFHHVDKLGKKTFMCAKGGKDHQERMKKLIAAMKKKQWTKGMKAEKVK